MKVVGKTVSCGKLLNVKVLVEGAAAERAYRATLNGVKCPRCGQIVNPKASELTFIIRDPLSTSVLGIDTGIVSTHCQCGHAIETMDEYDLSPFTDIVAFLKQLRSEYEKQQIAGRRNKNG